MTSLKNYISSVLVEIAEGVDDAKNKTDISIAPGRLNGKLQNEPQYVKFSVQVEVTEGNEKGKNGRASLNVIKVFNADGNINSKSSYRNSIFQTLEFDVPIFLQAKKNKN